MLSYSRKCLSFTNLCARHLLTEMYNERNFFSNMRPLIKWGTSMSGYKWFGLDREPWVAEVDTLTSGIGSHFIPLHCAPVA